VEVNSAAAHSGTLPLFRHLQPRAKWAVVQHCRPASACRFSSHSVAATVAQTYEQFCRALLTPSPRASIASCVHTHSHTIPNALVAGRLYHPSPHSHEQIHARQQSPPRPLCAHCPLPILGHVSPPSFVPYRQPIVTADKAGQTSMLMP
jgi:hypothetical protein